MTCRQLRPYLVDFARGAAGAAGVEEQVTRHVRGCEECRALLERERILSAALRRVAGAIAVPGASPAHQRVLLAAFDEARSNPPRGAARPFRLWPAAAAAALAVAAVGGWRLVRVNPAATQVVTMPAPSVAGPRADVTAPAPPPSAGTAGEQPRWPAQRPALRRPARQRASDLVEASFETSSFVAWPGAASRPPLESGSVVRVSLPVSILPALGLWPPPSAGSEVPADLLIGQDGFARAIRLVPE